MKPNNSMTRANNSSGNVATLSPIDVGLWTSVNRRGFVSGNNVTKGFRSNLHWGRDKSCPVTMHKPPSVHTYCPEREKRDRHCTTRQRSADRFASAQLTQDGG